MKKLTAALAILLTCSGLHAQQFFIKGKDTVLFRDMEYWVNMQGFVTDIKYTDSKGREQKVEGKKKLKDLESIHYNSGTVQRMPLKISKPDAYVRYGERAVDGKLQIHLYDDRYQTTDWVRSTIDSRMDKWKTTTHGTRLFYLRMPNGKLYDLSKKKDVKNVLWPYLEKCGAFKEKYKNKFSMDPLEIIRMVRLYNSVCG